MEALEIVIDLKYLYVAIEAHCKQHTKDWHIGFLCMSVYVCVYLSFYGLCIF